MKRGFTFSCLFYYNAAIFTFTGANMVLL